MLLSHREDQGCDLDRGRLTHLFYVYTDRISQRDGEHRPLATMRQVEVEFRRGRQKRFAPAISLNDDIDTGLAEIAGEQAPHGEMRDDEGVAVVCNPETIGADLFLA